MEKYKHGMDLKELIERGETQSLEFKESLRLKDEIGETVSAFSNSDGGTVIVGVSDSSSELRKLAKESGERVYWDEQICKEASLEDIEEEKNMYIILNEVTIRGYGA
jgi:predicted HTH transcriptional regulator